METPGEREQSVDMYLHGELPDIKVRELLSIDEALENDPTFLIFSREEIGSLIAKLLRVNKTEACDYEEDLLLQRKINSLLNLHKDVLENENRFNWQNNIMPHVDARIKEIDDDDETFLTEFENTMKINDYTTRIQTQRDLSYPYTVDVEAESQGGYELKAPFADVLFDYDDDKPTGLGVVDSRDSTQPRILGYARMNKYDTTSVNYLYELVAANKYKFDPLKILQYSSEDYDETHESFQEYANGLTELPTVHELNHMLKKYRWPKVDLPYLIEKLVELDSKNDETIDTTREDVRDKIPEPHKSSQIRLLEALLIELNKQRENKTHLHEKAKELSVIVQTWRQNPSFNPGPLPNEPFDIVKEYSANGQQLIDKLRYRREKDMRDTAEAFVHSLFNFTNLHEKENFDKNVDTNISNLESTLERANMHIEVEKDMRKFVDIYDEIEQFRQGEDESTYLGNPNEDTTVYVVDDIGKVAFPKAVESGIITGAHTKDNELPLEDILKKYLDPVLEKDVLPGVKECLVPVVHIIEQILKSSGLRLNMFLLITDLISLNPSIISRGAYIIERLEETDDETISDATIRDILRVIDSSSDPVKTLKDFGESDEGQILPAGLIETVLESLEAYRANVETMFLQALCLFTFEVQKAHLEGEYTFNPADGNPLATPYWDPYGLPLTDITTGCVVYLSVIAVEIISMNSKNSNSILKYTTHQQIIKKLTDAKLMKDTGIFAAYISENKDLFKEIYGANRITTKPVTAQMALNTSLLEKQRNPKTVLDRYYNVLLFLPQIYHRRDTTALVYPGCCVQKVGPEYAPDKDIGNFVEKFQVAKNVNQITEAKHWLIKTMKGQYKYDRFRLSVFPRISSATTDIPSNLNELIKDDVVESEIMLVNNVDKAYYTKWLKSIDNISKEDRTEFIRDSKNIKKKVDDELRDLIKHIDLSNTNKALIKEYLIDYDLITINDFESVIRMVIVVLSKLLKVYDGPTEQEFITTLIDDIRKINRYCHFNGDDVQNQFDPVKHVIRLLTLLALNEPFKKLKGNTYSAAFKTAITTDIRSALLNKIKARKLITTGDIETMISHRREEYKSIKLKRSDELDEDSRRLLKAFKDAKLEGFYDDTKTAAEELGGLIDLGAQPGNVDENLDPEEAVDFATNQEWGLDHGENDDAPEDQLGEMDE